MRKIHLTDPEYPAYYAYDTSGVYTDPGVSVDIRQGLPRLREAWIAARGDTEQLLRFTSPYAQRLYEERPPTMFPNPHLPRRARLGRAVTQLAYAKAGIITPEMEYIAIRENQLLDIYRQNGRLPRFHKGQSWACASRMRLRRSLCARKSPPAAPSFP